MTSVTVPADKLEKVLADVETLVEDVASLLDQDAVARERLAEIKTDPAIGMGEPELNSYLATRGVKIE